MGLRVVFHEEDDANAVAARLSTAGFSTTVARERFAGEDDDEDHPWAVVTDAPEFMVEVLAEEYDGWVDPVGDAWPTDVPAAAPELPDAPRRVKNHFPRD